MLVSKIELRWSSLIKDVHQNLVESELYTCYLAQISRSYRKKDIHTKWIVSVAACAPFVAKIGDISKPVASWFVALIPLLALLLPLLNYSKVIDTASSLHGAYSEILPELKSLWRKILVKPDSDTILEELCAEYSVLEKKLAAFRNSKLVIPDNEKIKDQCLAMVENYPVPEELGGIDREIDVRNRLKNFFDLG